MSDQSDINNIISGWHGGFFGAAVENSADEDTAELVNNRVKALTKKNKANIRHGVLRAIFKANEASSLKKFRLDPKKIDIDVPKSVVTVFKPKSSTDAEDIQIDMDTMTDDEGFYVNLSDKDDSIIINIPKKKSVFGPQFGKGKIKITVQSVNADGDRTYAVTNIEGTTQPNKKKEEYEDDDIVIFNDSLRVVFGGLGGGSTLATSGGFPHLYDHNIPGAFIDPSAVRSVAHADVAELRAALEPSIEIDDNAHLINIATKRALTATEFKQMFYARGDDEFSVANVYECPNIGSNILASVWGKRIESQAAGVFDGNTHGNDRGLSRYRWYRSYSFRRRNYISAKTQFTNR